MPETFTVHLGRDGARSIDAPASFEPHGSFVVELVNHGPATHVHLRLADGLESVARVHGDNPYVASESTEQVHVDVDAVDEEVRGSLVLATGYGAEETTVSVSLAAPANDTVEVDESLTQPPSRGPEPEGGLDGASPLALLGLGAVALLVAVVTLLFTQNLVLTVGAFVVAGGLLAASYVLLG